MSGIGLRQGQCEVRTDFNTTWNRNSETTVGADSESSNCPTFLKSHICKHVIGIAIRLKKFSVIPEAKNLKLGARRKRGRPAKASNALRRQ